MRITMEAATINHGGLQGGSEGCEERMAKGPEDRSIAAMRRAGWGWGARERKRVMHRKSPEAILMGSKTEKYLVMKMPPVGLPVKRKIAFPPANDPDWVQHCMQYPEAIPSPTASQSKIRKPPVESQREKQQKNKATNSKQRQREGEKKYTQALRLCDL